MKIYSIKEIVTATNNILNSTKKHDLKKNQMPKDAQPLILTKEIKSKAEKFIDRKLSEKDLIPKRTEEIIKAAEDSLLKQKKTNKPISENNTFVKINIKNSIKEDIVNELFVYLKKKAKKNTLKLLVDQQIEIRNLGNKLLSLQKNIKTLDNNYKNLQLNFDQSLKDNNFLKENNKNTETKLEELKQVNKSLEINNESLENKIQTTLVVQNKLEHDKQNIETELVEKNQANRALEINNHELKNSLGRYVINTKKLVNEINVLKNDHLEGLANNEELKKIKEKIKFFQEENVRLSSELHSAKRIYQQTKQNFNNIEEERNQISQQIQELTNSINKTNTNIFNTNFTKENIDNKSSETVKENADSQKENIDNQISKIFQKK